MMCFLGYSKFDNSKRVMDVPKAFYSFCHGDCCPLCTMVLCLVHLRTQQVSFRKQVSFIFKNNIQQFQIKFSKILTIKE
jgi:hypothetical protein